MPSLFVLLTVALSGIPKGLGAYQVIDLHAHNHSDLNLSANAIWIAGFNPIRRAAYEDPWRDGWHFPILANLALLAFENGSILEPPTTRSPYDFRLLIADTCQGLEYCSEQHTAQLMQEVYFGSKLNSNIFPPVVAAVGGDRESGRYPYRIANVNEIPTVGYVVSDADLSDKSLYKYFLRTNTPVVATYKVAVNILTAFSYTRAALWTTSSEEGKSIRDFTLEYAQANGLSYVLDVSVSEEGYLDFGTVPWDIPKDLFNFWTAGYEDWWAAFDFAAIKVEWESNIERVKAANTHANIMAFTQVGQIDFLPMDLLHYLAEEKLISSGQLWVGSSLNADLYHSLVGLHLRAPWNNLTGWGVKESSTFAMVVPFDSYLQVVPQKIGPRFESFWAWWKSMPPILNRTLEPWLAPRVCALAFEDPREVSYYDPLKCSFWSSVDQNLHWFDAIWTILRATNDVSIEYGLNFTGQQLLDKIRESDFEGLTGRITFDENGDRRNHYIVQQYQVECNGSQMMFDGSGPFGPYPRLGSQVIVGSYFEALELNRPLTYFGCATDKPPDKDLPCEEGSYYRRDAGICVQCERGKVAFEIGQSACNDCWAGAFMDEVGGSACKRCAPGYYNSFFGELNCSACPHGSHAADAASTTCSKCIAGKISNSEGQSACSDCAIAYYTNRSGQSNCFECGPRLTTMRKFKVGTSFQWVLVAGSDTESDCMCGFGYRSHANDCVSCDQDGLVCEGEPRIKAGFYADADFSVFKCRPPHRCKGGIPGETCEFGREGVTCDQCKPGMAPGDNGKCVDCEGSDLAPFCICVALALLILICTYYMVDSKNLAGTSHSMLLAAIAFGQLIAVVQLFSIVSLMSMDFSDPLAKFLGFMSVLVFEVSILRMDCVSHMGPVEHFVAKNAIILIVLIVVALIHVVFVFFRHGGNFRSRFPSLFAVLGTVCSVFFVSVASTAVAPFQCDQHPNGKWTVHKHQSVLCWGSNEHTTLVVLGIIFVFFVPVTFFSLCARIVSQYPSKIRSMDTNFLQAYAFLFARVNPETYWYSLLILCRSLLISFIPTIPYPMVQIMALQTIMVLMLITTISLSPWRVKGNNRLDAFSSTTIILFMSVAGFFVDEDDIDRKSTAWVCTFILIISAIGFPSLVCYRLAKVYLFKAKQFGFFLCHHKLGAGAYVRALKLCLVENPKIRGKVFVDCDDLSNLDGLFDIVGSEVSRLVVVCSKSVFLRPWCIGEITTAHTKKVPMSIVQLPEFGGLDAATIDAVDRQVQDIDLLAKSGISIDMIKEALHFLKDLPTIIAANAVDSSNMAALAKTLISGDDFVVSETSSKQKTHSSIAILCDTGIIEAMAAALVLQKLLLAIDVQAGMPSLRGFAVKPKGSHAEPRVEKTITLFSAGCLDRETLPLLLIEASREGLPMIPVLVEEGFRPPSASMLQDLRGRSPIRDHEMEPGEFASIVAAIFLRIAKEFTASMASETVLKVQCNVIAASLRDVAARQVTKHQSFPKTKDSEICAQDDDRECEKTTDLNI